MARVQSAGDPHFFKITQQQAAEVEKYRWYHSIELPGGTVVPGLVALADLTARIDSFPIPKDLTGKRVLDIGAATGWSSFEMERRGAEVLAVDCVEFEEFYIARKLLGSSVDYKILDVDELTPARVGRFDYVLFFGVLYHLRHPLLGLEHVCALTRDAAFIESFVTDFDLTPQQKAAGGKLLEFYETGELGGQIDNWFGPNTECLLALCRAAGFARVELQHVQNRRAGVVCYRHWADSPNQTANAPWINAAVNNRTNDVYFNPAKDEYICIYFRSSLPAISREDLRVEVDGYGAPVLAVAKLGGDGWQANLKLPPLLDAGTYEIRLRTLGSALSNTFTIHVAAPADAPVEPAFPPEGNAPAPRLFAVENNIDAAPVFRGYKNEYLCCYFVTSEAGLTKDRILLEIDGAPHRILFLTHLGDGRWQTNSKLPAGLSSGNHNVRLRTANSRFSEEWKIQVERAPDAAP